MDFAVVTSLLGIVEQQLLVQPHTSLILPDTQIILSLTNKLRFLQAHLDESKPEKKPLGKEISYVAEEAEDIIESRLSEVYLSADKGECVVEICQDLHQALQQVVKDIESIEVRIRDLQIRPTASRGASSTASLMLESITDGGSSKYDLEHESIMIGLDDGFEEIRRMLFHLPEYLEVISILGMGGAGKTTLARKIYEDRSIMFHFDIRAWTTVSREFSRKEVLIGILDRIVPLTSEISQEDDDQLAMYLRHSLMGQRYLIVIDDVWETEAWDELSRCFPDNYNGSRVLITTRSIEVAKYASEHIYQMRFLSPDESWNLLATKVFNGERCPLPELESIGRNIAEKCDGLPLAIVVIAGFLATLDKSPKQWEDVAAKINKVSTVMDPETDSHIFALSYNNLPSHLQVCWLYLGFFPKDSDIHVKKLIKLWVAEGFLKSEMGKSLEEVAENSLCDLIARSLVLVAKRSFDGKVKSCRLHDSLHDFCLRKAQEENTLVVINEYRDHLVGTWSGTEQSQPGCRWMSCQSRRWPVTRSSSLNYTWRKIRSILYFGNDLYLAKCKFVFPCLKLLRVLDLSLIKYWHGMPSEIVDLIHLRYLALTTTGSLYNFQFFKLQNLQTLILFSWMEECRLHLPCDILDLPWLRHVHLDKGSSLYLPNLVRENLQTLFWLKVASWDSKTPNFTRVPNLKELGIYIEGEVLPTALDSLVQLHQLEKLKFEIGRVERFNLLISFPTNLKKLTLRKTYLRWGVMDDIGKLPNLEVLKLKDFAFCGPKWEPIVGGFQQLKFLLIAHPDLEHWNASADHFPVLECLVLRCCWNLEELPNHFAKIHTLRLIELVDCCSFLVASAMQIQEEKLEMGYDEFLVQVLTEDKLPKNESCKEESELAV